MVNRGERDCAASTMARCASISTSDEIEVSKAAAATPATVGGGGSRKGRDAEELLMLALNRLPRMEMEMEMEMMKKKKNHIDGEERKGRVVLVPFPSQGRINPMLQLGTILYSKGFSITVVHPQFNCPDPSTHPHFTFESINDGISQEDISSWNIWNIIWGLNDNCEKPLKEWLDRNSYMTPDHLNQGLARITCDEARVSLTKGEGRKERI
ncbi:hypothetical protein Tsubulata_005597 [Turnera subulata]|uniref:Uncharacterized protein n=1 Tax=Turnera subulata TaxID=218843 RepID=A0A9Q0GEY3_9ROSI|nr:hypothetical protein Tsubulata_005597 [Turnera subulata]